jgi:membrane protein
LVLLASLGLFLELTSVGRDAQRFLLEAIGTLTSPLLEQQVGELLENVREHAVLGGPLGIVGLCFAAIILFAQFERAFDHIWNTGARRPSGILAGLKHVLMFRLRALLMMVILGGVLVIVFVAGMSLAAIQATTDAVLPSDSWLWWLAQVTLSICINSVILACIYKWLPKTKVHWRDAYHGGLLTAIVWEAGRIVLASIVIGSRFTNAYGMIGSFIGVMLWFYFAAAVIFLGAEYVQVIRSRRGEKS